nr:MAG TPA: hypothetical protein [Bacteriophage sp.]
MPHQSFLSVYVITSDFIFRPHLLSPLFCLSTLYFSLHLIYHILPFKSIKETSFFTSLFYLLIYPTRDISLL